MGPNVFANSETEALASHSVRHGLGVLLDAFNGRELPVFQGLKIEQADFDASVENFIAITGSLDVADVEAVDSTL